MTEIQQDKPDEDQSPDRPTSAPPSFDLQGDIFTPFNTNTFGSIFSDMGSYSEQKPVNGVNNQYDQPKYGNEHSNNGTNQIWGTQFESQFANISLNSDDLFHSDKNLQNNRNTNHSNDGMRIFQTPDNTRSQPRMNTNYLWGDSPTYTQNYSPQEPPNNFSMLNYNPVPDNNMGMQRNVISRSQNEFSNNGNSFSPIRLNNSTNSSHPFQSFGNNVPANQNPMSGFGLNSPVLNSPPSSMINNTGNMSGSLHHSNPGELQSNVNLANDDNSLVSVNHPQGYVSNNSNKICRYYVNGNCMRGDRCNYLHIRGDSNRKDDKKKDKQKRFVNQKANGRRPRNVPLETNKPVVDVSRFTSIDQVVGQVYRTCKDQHGCRFLQKKLEEKDQENPKAVEIIFNEVYDYMVELMTDPFGNYLCQKLIEHCNQQQQLLIVQKVAPHLVAISKNMHGTRAVQKMIECLCTSSQVQLVVNSLRSSVVSLIKDLNGNHVIQRCLHELSYQNKQFVYDAVAENCVEVATHRHGCCVMQRCIDSASEGQKLQLVRQISSNVLLLVQDQFGNYVVQYVLDLPFSTVKVNLIQEFLGTLSSLSTQKFSSNVIEKCLHVADESVKVQLIDELMETSTLNGLLQDPFGNYVIQTALTEAQPEQRARLEDQIRPLLPALRNTNYGKRIQNKITLKDDLKFV